MVLIVLWYCSLVIYYLADSVLPILYFIFTEYYKNYILQKLSRLTEKIYIGHLLQEARTARGFSPYKTIFFQCCHDWFHQLVYRVINADALAVDTLRLNAILPPKKIHYKLSCFAIITNLWWHPNLQYVYCNIAWKLLNRFFKKNQKFLIRFVFYFK